MHIGISAERVPRVVGHIQPFVSVAYGASAPQEVELKGISGPVEIQTIDWRQ